MHFPYRTLITYHNKLSLTEWKTKREPEETNRGKRNMLKLRHSKLKYVKRPQNKYIPIEALLIELNLLLLSYSHFRRVNTSFSGPSIYSTIIVVVRNKQFVCVVFNYCPTKKGQNFYGIYFLMLHFHLF